MKTKTSSGIVGTLLIAGSLLAMGITYYQATSTDKNTLYFESSADGQAYMCWENTCAWSNIPSKESIETASKSLSGPGSTIPNIVTATPVNITTKVRIMKYPPTIKETYSPLKSFVYKDKLLLFSLLEEYKENNQDLYVSKLYLYNLNTNTIQLLASSNDYLLAFSIDPDKASYITLHNKVEFKEINLSQPSYLDRLKSSFFVIQRDVSY